MLKILHTDKLLSGVNNLGVHHLVYDRVEESRYQELSQVCHYPCADVDSLYICVKTRLNILVLLLNISHIPVSKIYFPIFKECARFTLTTKRDKKQRLWSREWYVYQQQLYSHDHTTRNISYPKKGTLHQLTDFYLILTLAQS